MSLSQHHRRQVLAGALMATFAGAVPRAFAQAESSDPKVRRAVLDVVVANRILAHQGVVDAYGHVSMRHPTDPGRYLLSRSRSPAIVEASDIMEFKVDSTPINPAGRNPYLERFIHGEIYRNRPDIRAIVHSHSPEVLPYTITKTPLRPVIHSAGMIGAKIPVWDIRSKYGDTNLLVVDNAQGADLAKALGGNSVVLMRAHGFVAAGRNLMEVLRMAVYLRLNATVLTEASRLGEVTPLSDGEIARIANVSPDAPEVRRAWEYWASAAGVSDLLKGP